MNDACTSCGYTYDPQCEVCHGFGAPSPRVQQEPELTRSSETVYCERCKKDHVIDTTPVPVDHPIFDVHPTLREASPASQRAQVDSFDKGIADMLYHEDAEWLRKAGEILGFDSVLPEARTIAASFTASLSPDVRSFKQERRVVRQAVVALTEAEDAKVKPRVLVREIDHSKVYSAVEGVAVETGDRFLLTNQSETKRNGVYRAVGRDEEAEAKLKETARYQPRSRVGSAVPPSKSKATNRSKAKAAKKARKMGRRL
jgi:hypothetical protein